MRRPPNERSRIRACAVLVLLLLAASFGPGCGGRGGFGGLPGRERVSTEERTAYQAALAHLPGDPRAAETELEAFLAAFPTSSLADDAAEELARLALVQGRRDDAFRWLELVVTRYPQGDRADAARVRLARWEAGRDDTARARELLGEVRPDRLDVADRRAYHRLAAQLASDPVERVRQLAALRASLAGELAAVRGTPDEAAASARLDEGIAAVDSEIDGVLLALDGEQLGRLAVALSGPPPAARVRLILARQALDAGDASTARRLIERARRDERTPRDEERLAALELRLGLGGELAAATALPTYRDAAAQPRAVLDDVTATLGVVLPLSGPYAEFGEEALRGVMLAAGVFDLGPSNAGASAADAASTAGQASAATTGSASAAAGTLDPLATSAPAPLSRPSRVRLLVRDSAGMPDRAATAVRELAVQAGVVAIIGPIFSEEAEAAAREAEALRVPLLALSNRVELARERDFVFRLRITPDDEVAFLVAHAFEKLGARRFAVLYPESRYGRGMRTRYWDAVVERGGAMVAAASYDPETTDYADSIRSMVGYDLLTRKEQRALDERAAALRRGRRFDPKRAAVLRSTLAEVLGPEGERLPPVVDFDVLFVPDTHDRIGLLAPQLAYHEVTGIRLLGTGEWYHPELVQVAQQHVRGALISTSFDPESPFEHVRAFVAAYRASFEREPASLSADAFDASQLVLEQLAIGRGSRDGVRDGLLRVRGHAGVTGVIQIEADGNARKRPFLLEVRGSRFVSIDATD